MENERESLERVVGLRTRTLRTERGWSQTELAHKLKPYGFRMTQTTVAKLESGGRPTRIDEAQALADIFGLPIADLLRLNEDDEMTPNEDERAMLLRRRMHLEAQMTDAQDKLAEAQERQAVAAAQVQQLHGILGGLSAEYREVSAAVHGGEAFTASRVMARMSEKSDG